MNLIADDNHMPKSLSFIPPAFPDGHFYSPVININEVKGYSKSLWHGALTLPGIDFNGPSQQKFIEEEFAMFINDYSYPDEITQFDTPDTFYTNNSQFGWLDSRVLFVMLRSLRPNHMIEIGSGFSSLLTANVNRRFLDGSLRFTCIEPYPREFLLNGVPGISRLIQKKVQDVPLEIFDELNSGDILFVDSSHVSKTGSDVNRIIFDIMPRLKPGVYIHFHDIFLPFEYPQNWILEEGRSWNEQYIVRALLMYSTTFQIVFNSMYACSNFGDLLLPLLGGKLYGGGSMWIKRLQ